MNIVDASVSAKTNARKELYDRFTSSSVKLKFVAGRSWVEVVLGCPETAELMAALADPFPAPQLELLSMLEVREPRLRQSFCNFMGCVKVVCPEQLTNGRMVGEVRLLDETSDTVIMKLWESEQIRMAASWEPRDTVIFAANVMVEFDSYKGINVLAGSSRSVTAGYVGRFNAITCAVFDFSDSTSETLQKNFFEQLLYGTFGRNCFQK